MLKNMVLVRSVRLFRALLKKLPSSLTTVGSAVLTALTLGPGTSNMAEAQAVLEWQHSNWPEHVPEGYEVN